MEQQALLKRIAELSRLVNAAEAPKAKRHKSANRVYVRTDPAPAVVATSHLVPPTPVVAQQTVSSPRMTRRHDFASNARWKPRPPPISRSKLREYKVTQKKQKKAKTGNVFLVDDDIVAKVGDKKTFLSFADASHGLSSGRQAEKDKHR